jgi:hypothetical protein
MKMNPWKSINGAVCLNAHMGLIKSQPSKIDDIIVPVCYLLYLSNSWDKLNFSKTDKIEDLRPHVSADVIQMKDILLSNSKSLTDQVNSYLDHLNGSMAFSVVLVQALYNGNQKVYSTDLLSLMQECWEISFWFLNDLKDQNIRNLICDFSDNHIVLFDRFIADLNAMNPL